VVRFGASYKRLYNPAGKVGFDFATQTAEEVAEVHEAGDSRRFFVAGQRRRT
jgi:hypothetical protein